LGPVSGEKASIVLIDSDASFRGVVVTEARTFDLEVFLAASLVDGRELVERLDVQLVLFNENGLDGDVEAFLRWLRDEHPKAACIVCTREQTVAFKRWRLERLITGVLEGDNPRVQVRRVLLECARAQRNAAPPQDDDSINHG
jgi:DNA-binding NtrC family response regulator